MQKEFDRFERRWNGLSKTIFSLAGSILGDEGYELELPTSESERGERLAEILAHAQAIKNAYTGEDLPQGHFNAKIFLALNYLWLFAGERIAYFNEGFFKGEINNLEHSIPYPPQYVINQLLARSSRDVSTYQKLYAQRQTPLWRDHLEKTDYLANLALKPAINSGLVDEAQIITYFHKEMSIRVIPYASVALIAIPYESLENPIDLMAIPHEVGHHVYVNGLFREVPLGRAKYISQALDVKAAEYPFWIRQWMEEIFADVYGAIVAGPVMALSNQYMIGEKSPKGRVTDDGEHPVDIVRPLVYQYILRSLNEMPLADKKDKDKDEATAEAVPDVAKRVIKALEMRWGKSNLGIRPRFRPKAKTLGFNEDDHGRYISEEEAAGWLQKIFAESPEIATLRDALLQAHADAGEDELTLFPFGNWGQLSEQTLTGSADEVERSLELMFDNFVVDFNRQFEMAALSLEQASVAEVKQLKLEDVLVDELYSTLLIYTLRQANGIQVPIDVWVHVYEGDAWGEHGPMTRPAISDDD